MNNPSGLKFAFGEPPLTGVKTNRKQPVQSRSQATCSAILEATIQVLVQQGPDRLTTTRVAERAGVSVGTLYQYYPNKLALTEAVRAEYFRLMSGAVRTCLVETDDLTPFDKLMRALNAVINMKRSHAALSLALAKIPADTEGGDFSADVVEHFSLVLSQLISEGTGFNEAQQKEAHALVAAIEGALSYAVKNASEWLDEPWFTEHLHMMARGGLERILTKET